VSAVGEPRNLEGVGRPRGRHLLWLVLFLIGMFVYAGLAIRLGEALPGHWAVQAVFYLVAGVIWVWPLVALIRLLARRDAG
jgi:hypothetical protein